MRVFRLITTFQGPDLPANVYRKHFGCCMRMIQQRAAAREALDQQLASLKSMRFLPLRLTFLGCPIVFGGPFHTYTREILWPSGLLPMPPRSGYWIRHLNPSGCGFQILLPTTQQAFLLIFDTPLLPDLQTRKSRLPLWTATPSKTCSSSRRLPCSRPGRRYCVCQTRLTCAGCMAVFVRHSCERVAHCVTNSLDSCKLRRSMRQTCAGVLIKVVRVLKTACPEP